MNTRIPEALRHGDTIGLVSPSSPSPDLHRINQAVTYLERLGYRVRAARHFNRRTEDRHELDRMKLSDLHEMFSDTSVKAIFCLRGGSGATRLLQHIDYELISRNPKIFAGYSDVTALSAALLARTGLLTFSGPMLATELHSPSPYTEANFWNMLTSPGELHEIVNHPDHPQDILRPGTAEGRLLAGNLTVLACLSGTPFLPSPSNSVMLVEDINEEPYCIDRLLSHFDNTGALHRCSALLFGQFTRSAMRFDLQAPLTAILRYYCDKTRQDVPVAGGISYGHIDDLLTIPVGARCRVEAHDGRLTLRTTAPVTR
ncbi:LD-carboxypeptidase [Prosthecochloris sp. N3]|uniref:LD-carboxypeptidase n=1 Tax=Prosthecochloris ethylica TaxID=2743976 RepID=A0ABR9XRH1_9CHLB|nr:MULTISPECIES: LD-carboxypeptidase [Prosthecochloris]MEC9487184.1 LD-carboxypeptidase [Prosthecochloris sp.]MBF0585982.1 LD-carboxypeptidase [Prosthecochloris ethylica]MBF0636618.1 LD-carboxypeptidase [Prosthecochloris ethylica]NUK47250.1 LD-carboxypeptidase [Prosthecochloris ethylica]RNA64050.1 LD-carboxypeptidase [Prosthecochloris sp. ZM_2]